MCFFSALHVLRNLGARMGQGDHRLICKPHFISASYNSWICCYSKTFGYCKDGSSLAFTFFVELIYDRSTSSLLVLPVCFHCCVLYSSGRFRFHWHIGTERVLLLLFSLLCGVGLYMGRVLTTGHEGIVLFLFLKNLRVVTGSPTFGYCEGTLFLL